MKTLILPIILTINSYAATNMPVPELVKIIHAFAEVGKLIKHDAHSAYFRLGQYPAHNSLQFQTYKPVSKSKILKIKTILKKITPKGYQWKFSMVERKGYGKKAKKSYFYDFEIIQAQQTKETF